MIAQAIITMDTEAIQTNKSDKFQIIEQVIITMDTEAPQLIIWENSK